jgi:UDP-2,4-diacetamido-2,4,6-trideoxy-beta-L-altropyranose hydrolase
MKATELFIRADGGPVIGIGHLVRTAALGQAWTSQRGSVTFVTSCPVETLPRAVTTAGFKIRHVQNVHPDPADGAELLRLSTPGTWVCCDGYHFDAMFTNPLRAAGRRVLQIDDIAHASSYGTDILLNQNTGADELDYHCEPETVRLLGTNFALIRPEFRRSREVHRVINDRARRIVIAIGGADPYQLRERALRALAKVDEQLQIRLVVPPTSTNARELDQLGRTLNLQLTLDPDPSDLPGLLMWADLAIAGGGSTCWELCCLGVPSVVITYADNQTGITSGLQKAGAAVHLGWAFDVSDSLLEATLRDVIGDSALRTQLSSRARSLVDGRGAERVVNAMGAYTTESDLCQR